MRNIIYGQLGNCNLIEGRYGDAAIKYWKSYILAETNISKVYVLVGLLEASIKFNGLSNPDEFVAEILKLVDKESHP